MYNFFVGEKKHLVHDGAWTKWLVLSTLNEFSIKHKKTCYIHLLKCHQ